MDIISILGLVLGLAVLIMMGFKGWGMIPTSIVGALVVVITNRMDLWEALSTHYGTFMKNYAGDYFLMFFLGTLFGALMGSSGAAKSIACKIVDLMGSKRALLIVVITSAVLSYGGVSFAVVVFTLYPIALVLFKEGNVSKRLFPAALFAGCASFTMVGLPGSPQIQNIMPTEVLGTTAYAAPLNGIVVSCIIFALSMVWLEWNDKRLKAAGIGFVPGRKDDLEAIDISDRTGMLPFGLAVIPILFVVLYIFVMQQVLKDAVTWSTNYIVIQSLALGCLLAFATGTSWGTFGILIPITIAIFGDMGGQVMVLTVAAVLAGAVCGDHISPISDTTILASTGANCNHIEHVSTQMPYALLVAACCLIGYLVAGFTSNGWLGLGVGFVLLMAALIVLLARFKKQKGAEASQAAGT